MLFTSVKNEISFVTVAPKALEIIVAISARVKNLSGSMVVSDVPIRSSLSTAAVIASVDQSFGKSSKSSTLAANEKVCISIMSASNVAIKRVAFFMVIFLSATYSKNLNI